MFNILIVSATGKTLEEIKSLINPIGAHTITTETANYYTSEFSVDFKSNQIIIHVTDDVYYF